MTGELDQLTCEACSASIRAPLQAAAAERSAFINDLQNRNATFAGRNVELVNALKLVALRKLPDEELCWCSEAIAGRWDPRPETALDCAFLTHGPACTAARAALRR